jgi:hypothetical protein
MFRALHAVTLRDMKLAWLLGEIRYLPARVAGHLPAAASHRPFFSILTDSGTLVLHDDAPREVVTGSAARLHRINQAPVRFDSREAFDAFAEPDHEKLFMSVRVAPTGRPGERWLVLEHATRALSPAGERKFARYWRIIRPSGAFVSRELLKAVRRNAEHAMPPVPARGSWRRVRASRAEREKPLPGDQVIGQGAGSLTHAVTIHRSRRDVWPWLAQMGAGSRAGWYSYDWLDNGRQPSATGIVPELQHIEAGMIFPALPGVTGGFTLLAFDPERFLILGWLEKGRPVVSWAFVLEDAEPGTTRLIVRARGGKDYRFQGLPEWLSAPVGRAAHFVMQRRQLLGIALRAESHPRRGADTGPIPAGTRQAAA